MALNLTQTQNDAEESDAKWISLLPNHPPAPTPGYKPASRLGRGAHGEVWLGIENSTGRKVAIKFYSSRRCVDWADLEREVKKLVLLAENRSIVQILHFGRDSDPPYYVMEYLEAGSLEERIKQHGKLPVPAAIEMFSRIAQALVHAHAKGVFHCDLKPANILLDQDHNPCLADFGQSRLSTESAPALGTLFFMAPEQADLKALPDARWDIYALGAVAHYLLAGKPPLAYDDLKEKLRQATGLVDRLALYQQSLRESPPAKEHYQVPGVDRRLAEIVDRCLERDPQARFQSAEEVVRSLELRERDRRRWRVMVPAIVGAMVMLAATSLVRWSFNIQAINKTAAGYTSWALTNNESAATFAAERATAEFARLMETAQDQADDAELAPLLAQVLDSPELATLVQAGSAGQSADAARQSYRESQPQNQLDAFLAKRLGELNGGDDENPKGLRFDSLFINDAVGTQLAGAFRDEANPDSIGRNFAYRTYFHGGDVEQAADARPPLIAATHISAPYRSSVNGKWRIAFSTPLYRNGSVCGMLALTVNIGEFSFLRMPQNDNGGWVAVLVDGREKQRGRLLQHPAFDGPHGATVLARAQVDDSIKVDEQLLHQRQSNDYRDPVAKIDPGGQDYANRWVAVAQPVQKPRKLDAGAKSSEWMFIVIQSDYEAIAQPARDLKSTFLLGSGAVIAVALLLLGGVLGVLWRLEWQPSARLAAKGV